MKKALVIAVVLLLVVIGLPVLMPGMGGAPPCADCGPATLAGAMCFAVLTAAVALVLASSRRARGAEVRRKGVLRAVVFDRPPQVLLAV